MYVLKEIVIVYYIEVRFYLIILFIGIVPTAQYLETPYRIGHSTGDIRSCCMVCIGAAIGSMYRVKIPMKLVLKCSSKN